MPEVQNKPGEMLEGHAFGRHVSPLKKVNRARCRFARQGSGSARRDAACARVCGTARSGVPARGTMREAVVGMVGEGVWEP